MKAVFSNRFDTLWENVKRGLTGPQALAFLPAITLAGFWLGGEALLIAVALGLPAVFVLGGGRLEDGSATGVVTLNSDLIPISVAQDLANNAVMRARSSKLDTACFMVDVEGLDEVAQRSGEECANALRDLTLQRLRHVLRRDDVAARVADHRYVIFLAPSLRLDLESLLQLATRLQSAVEEPAAVDNAMRYLAASLGFTTTQRMGDDITGDELLQAAQIALQESLLHGPSAIRAWSENMHAAHTQQKSLQHEIDRALTNGQIQPWFQPQICTSTGRITGVEALARWIHPERGIVPPAHFLRALEDAGRMAKLGEVILQHSLTAMRSWDQAGLEIPRVGVNFSDSELRDPKLVERLQWELDRFGLTPHRLAIEVLETVIAGAPEGIVARNVLELGKLGCHIDLDDFGTGHASIPALRRFKVHRLKIDRSFVSRVDRDEDQHRMLAAILGMADRLGLETLAEGVETVGEHALLAQLGCDHVQGFGIARPMPGDQLLEWSQKHAERIASAQKLGRSPGSATG